MASKPPKPNPPRIMKLRGGVEGVIMDSSSAKIRSRSLLPAKGKRKAQYVITSDALHYPPKPKKKK